MGCVLHPSPALAELQLPHDPDETSYSSYSVVASRSGAHHVTVVAVATLE